MALTPQQINQKQGFARPSSSETAKKDVVVTKPMPKQAAPATNLPATMPEAPLPAVPDGRSAHNQFLDQYSGNSLVGRWVDGDGKVGVFNYKDDGSAVSPDAIWVAIPDQVQVGHVMFGETLQKWVGLLYDGFIPNRTALGELDESQWPVSDLTGQPEDPIKAQMALVLQNTDTGEFITYATVKRSGLKAIANLLKHYDRMAKTHPGFYPLVQLKFGGYNHKTYGWIHTPTIAVVGKVPVDGVAQPEPPPFDYNDQIPL